MARDAGRLLHDRVRQLIRLGARDVQVHAEHRRGVRERRRDVVAVADERDRAAAQRSQLFPQRQEVGNRLARMLFVGQRVDDVQPRRRGGELREQLLRERSDDDGVDPALEIARDVGDRLAPAERRRRAAARRCGRPARARRSRTSTACAATACRTASRRGGRRGRRRSAPGVRARGPPSAAPPGRGSARDRAGRGRGSRGSPSRALS